MGAVALVAGGAARVYDADDVVVAGFQDGPHRYFDTVFSGSYCRAHGLFDTEPPTEPATLDHPAERVVTSWTRCATVLDPRRFSPATEATA